YSPSRCPSGAPTTKREVSLRVSGTLALAMQDQGLTSTESPALNIFTLLLNADPLVQAVLAILILFSAAAWGIIVYKRRPFRRSQKQTRLFLDVFRRSSRFAEVQEKCDQLAASPLVGLFQAGYAELNAQMRGAGENKPGAPPARPTLKSLDAVDRALI